MALGFNKIFSSIAKNVLGESQNQAVRRTAIKLLRTKNKEYICSQLARMKSDSGCKNDEKCPKSKLPCCAAPARKDCRIGLDSSKCCKQEAPYPAYSEKCVEELLQKPSECKLCPWTPDKHPYFEYIDEFPHFKHPKKPKKKHYSTWATMSVRKYSTNSSITDENLNAKSLLPLTFGNSLLLDNSGNNSEYILKKDPCKKPPPKCGPTPAKKKKKEKKGNPCGKKDKDPCKKKKCSSLDFETVMTDDAINDGGLVLTSLTSLELGSKKKSKKDKCKKFPYPPKKSGSSSDPCEKRKGAGSNCPGSSGGCGGMCTMPLDALRSASSLLYNSLEEQIRDSTIVEITPVNFKKERDNECPPKIEKSKICPKESILLPRRKKVKRPPLCSEKVENKAGSKKKK